MSDWKIFLPRRPQPGRAIDPSKRVAITAEQDRKERGESDESQLDSSKRDLCNVRRRAHRLCGDPFLPRLLRRWLSLRNPRLLLRRVAGMARGIVYRSTGRLLTEAAIRSRRR